MTSKIPQALAIAFEVSGCTLTEAAAKAMLLVLAPHPEEAVLRAIQRCMSEVTGRLTLAHIVDRIEDGRPTPDEAWAQVGTLDEGRTLVTTHEAMEAMAGLEELLRRDPVAARMAYRERYRAIVARARSAGRPVQWYASLGHDKSEQQAALALAVQHEKLDAEYAAMVTGCAPADLLGLAGPALPALRGKGAESISAAMGNLLGTAR